MGRPFKKEPRHPVLLKFLESVYLEVQEEAEELGLAATSYCMMLVQERRKQLKVGRQ